MNSRVHPSYKTRYRVTNWAEYDQALVERGNFTLWITPLAIKTWSAMATGLRGAPRKYSDLAIETALTIRLLFHLPLWQTEGFLRSLFDLMGLGLDVPDHTTLSRRGSTLKVNLGVLQSKKPMHLIIDSSGLSIVGEGEWAAVKHGGGGKRGWRKLHVGVDANGRIQTQVLTKSNVDDVTTGIKIIKATKGKLNRVTADAAYDAVGFYEAAGARGARVVVPAIAKASVTGRGPRSAERERTIRKVEKLGRREWKKQSGYHRQGTVENAFFRYKTILGGKLHARGLSAQKAEATLGCKILNRLLDCGRPKSVAIGR
jgi:IS5 family transposase